MTFTRLSIVLWYSKMRILNSSSGRDLGHRFGPVENVPASGWSAGTSAPTRKVCAAIFCQQTSSMLRLQYEWAGRYVPPFVSGSKPS